MATEPQVLSGPEINGRKTNLHLFEPGQLACSPLLPGFLPPMNAAFSLRHPPWIPASHIRMHSTDQFLEELGPEAFTYALTFADDTEEAKHIIATVSFRPFRWREPEIQEPTYKTFYYDRSQAVVPGAETWDLKLMVVDPNYMKHGLASLLLGITESEIHRRFEERKLHDANISTNGGTSGIEAAQKKLRLLLQTLDEMNGEFYRKRGWTLIGTRKREKGFMGSEVGFTVGIMDKVFDF